MIIMIENGNIFDSNCQALVNPVNCYGNNGAGLAKQFKIKFPEYDLKHIEICKNKILIPGSVYSYQLYDKPKWIIDFATKNHWRNPSELEWIELGLDNLIQEIYNKNIESIAIPALGSGLGKLDWIYEVKPVILKKLSEINILIEVYEPLK